MRADLTIMLDYGVHLIRWLVCVTTVVILLASGSRTEDLLHTQEKSSEQEPETQTRVHNKDEAQVYLQKYGYLNCVHHRTKREAYTPPRGGQRESAEDKRNCTEDDIRDAIRNLQHHFNIPQTGEFDEETMNTMNKVRCGNSDKETETESAIDDELSRLPLVLRAYDSEQIPRSPLQEAGASDFVEAGRFRRSVRSIIDTIRPPSFEEAPSTENPRMFFNEEMLQKLRKDELRDKVLKRITKRKSIFHDVIQSYQRKRRKRSTPTQQERFNIEDGYITWELPQIYYSRTLSEIASKRELTSAFRMWSEVMPAKFKYQSQDADILTAFGRGNHDNCIKPFDGKGGELAHSWTAGPIHFDDQEHYSENDQSDGVYFRKVALHEVGHVLGLKHVERTQSIMYPLFQSVRNNGPVELDSEDRRYVQSIYGVCKGKFDVVFDWLRQNEHYDGTNAKYIFSTYFFRDDHYWMYENRNARPRYGDPHPIQRAWTGLPAHLDASVQIRIEKPGSEWDIETYFFKGSLVYTYNSSTKSTSGQPMRIADKFGAKAGSSGSIPDNIDAAYHDMDRKAIFFFKDEWVWKYQVGNKLQDNNCCANKTRFTDMFPNQRHNANFLSGYIDTVYYSIQQRIAYLFKGEKLYQMYQKDNEWFLLQLPGPWYNYWKDICDVE